MREYKRNRMKKRALRAHRHSTICRRVAIQWIACHWMAKMGSMHAYLVGASSLDCELNESHGTLTTKHLPMSHRTLSIPLDNSHALRIPRAASNESFKRARTRLWHAMKDGKIHLAHGVMRLKRTAQREIRRLRLRKHHHAARVGIQPMHNPRTRNAAHSLNCREMGKRIIN